MKIRGGCGNGLSRIRSQFIQARLLSSTSFLGNSKAPIAGPGNLGQRIVPPFRVVTEQKDFDHDMDISLLGYLQSRNLLDSVTSDDLFEITEPGKTADLKLYCGADPSASSLHIGNLLPLIVMLHFNLRGYDVFGLVGGATGAVGDPSGRTTERAPIEARQREKNVDNIMSQMSGFLSRGIEYAKSRNYPIEKTGTVTLVNNKTWWESIKMLDFLATYGSHIRISNILARDSVQSRLKSNQGLGFNEFTYQILQAYDFWHLFKEQGVNLQIGGNDQWGNITAGTDLISRLAKKFDIKSPKISYGITVPLLTTPSGEKFGKSAGNAVFISEELTTPFQLYQYFVNTSDDMVSKLLKIFTVLPMPVIEQVINEHEKDPGSRLAQRILAREISDLIHGVGTGDEMAYITTFLFPTPERPFDDDISADKLISKLRKSGLLISLKFSDFNNIHDLKMSTLLSKIMKKSKTETKNLIKAGGVYLGLGREQFQDPDDVVLFDPAHHLIDGKLLLVRVGKQNYYLVEFS